MMICFVKDCPRQGKIAYQAFSVAFCDDHFNAACARIRDYADQEQALQRALFDDLRRLVVQRPEGTPPVGREG